MNRLTVKAISLVTLACAFFAQTAFAQTNSFASSYSQTKQFTAGDAFRHLDISATVGSTGLGIDIATPISNMLQLRGGFAFMPSWHYNMSFGVQVGNDPETSKSKFEKMRSFLEQMTGYEVDDCIDMIGRPTFYNFKLMLDIFPFNNKHWHFTAGAYFGSTEVADAYNPAYEMQSLLAVKTYNTIYEKCENYDPIMDFDDDSSYPDVYLPGSIYDKIYDNGRMGMHVGDYKEDVYDESGNLLHKAGDPYMMEPDKDGMVHATMKSNAVKPYLGFGYGGRLVKDNDRINISFDAGAMFWGGSPDIYTHDGTNLTKDVEHISGKVGDYVDIAKSFKVFPVLNLRITYNLF